MSNNPTLYAHADEETREWRAFVRTWWAEHKTKTVGTEDLFRLVEKHQVLLDVLGEGSPRSRRTRLGKALGQIRDRVIAGLRIVNTGQDNHDRQQYRLEPLAGITDVIPTLAEVDTKTSVLQHDDLSKGSTAMPTSADILETPV